MTEEQVRERMLTTMDADEARELAKIITAQYPKLIPYCERLEYVIMLDGGRG